MRQLDGVERASFGPVSISAVFQVRLEDRFQHQFGGGLDDPVPDGGNAKRPFPAARFGDHHPTHRLGPVGPRGDILAQSRQPPFQARRLDRLERHPVHSRRAVVVTGQRIGVFENVRPINLVVEKVEAVGGLRLRLAIELPLKAADLFRSCKAHRQSPRPSPASASTSEVRGLCSAGVTRPQRSYAPVRLPLEAAIPKMALRLAPRPKRVSPDDPSLSSDAPRPLPRRIGPVHLSMTSQPVLPAPSLWRVGIRIKTFEACSGFTRITARKIAQLPKATFVTRLRSSQSPGQTARQLPDPSTLIRVEPSSTRETRLQGAHRDIFGPSGNSSSLFGPLQGHLGP